MPKDYTNSLSILEAIVLVALLVGVFLPVDLTSAAAPEATLDSPPQSKLDQFVRLPDARRPVRDWLAELAAAVSMPLVISPDVSQRSLNETVHFGLVRSTGAQAMAWISAITGFGIDALDDMLVVSAQPADRTGLECVGALGAGSAGKNPQASQRAHADVLQRIADVDLLDASLAQALLHIRDRYHLDLVADPALLANQDLVTINRRETPLQIVLDDLVEQCGAKVIWMDSGFWLRAPPSVATANPTPPPVPPAAPSVADRTPMVHLRVREMELNALLTAILKLGAIDAPTRSVRHAERGRKVMLVGAGSTDWLVDALVATPP